jgi:hypothetical protein
MGKMLDLPLACDISVQTQSRAMAVHSGISAMPVDGTCPDQYSLRIANSPPRFN